MNDQLKQAAMQALEALESGMAFDRHAAVLQNLRTALEQPEQEPLAWMSVSGDWVTRSKLVMENHASKGTVFVPLYK
jgi:hypothetical protein